MFCVYLSTNNTFLYGLEGDDLDPHTPITRKIKFTKKKRFPCCLCTLKLQKSSKHHILVYLQIVLIDFCLFCVGY